MSFFDESNLQIAIGEFGRRVKQKIRSIGYQSDLFCYLLVEELLLLLDIPVVCVTVSESLLPGFSAAIMDADTNISPADLAVLFETEMNAATELQTGVSQRLINNQDNRSKLMNKSLHNLKAQVELDIVATAKNDWRYLRVFFWYPELPETKDERRTLHGLINGGVSWYFLLGELQAILRAGFPSTPGSCQAPESVNAPDALELNKTSDQSLRDEFIENKRTFLQESNLLDIGSIREAYRSRFLPLVTIVERIDRACASLIAPDHNSEYIFSYRTQKEKGISFLLTTDQVVYLLQDPSDLKNLLTALFVRPSDNRERRDEYVGLSGYVLESGHSMFSRDPQEEPLWLGRSLDKRNRIHFLIGKLQQRKLRYLSSIESPLETSSETAQKNTFIIPLYIQRTRDEKRRVRIGEEEVQALATKALMLVECRLPDSYEEQLVIRRNLFDLVWEFMPAIEASVTAQRATEQVLRSEELRRSDLGRWAALVHDLPKQIVQPTETAVKNAKQQFGFLCKEAARLPEKRVSRIQQDLDLAIMMTRHASGLMRFAMPKTRSKDDTLEKRTIVFSEFRSEFRHTLKTFVESRVEARFGPRTYNPALPGEKWASISQYIKTNVSFSNKKDFPEKFRSADHLMYSIVRNHLENSFEELILFCKERIVAEPALGRIDVDVQCQQQPHDYNIVITISDCGRGIQQPQLSEKQKNVKDVLNGKFPDWTDLLQRRSEKPGNMGLGLFNSAAMLYEMNQDPDFPGHRGHLELLRRGDGRSGLVVRIIIPIC